MTGKLVSSLREAITACGLKDGMCISFHHHLRNGDHVLNMVMAEISDMGFRGLCVSASSIHDVHLPLASLLEQGVVTDIDTNYISAGVGRTVSAGTLDIPVTFRSHGGQAPYTPASVISTSPLSLRRLRTAWETSTALTGHRLAARWAMPLKI